MNREHFDQAAAGWDADPSRLRRSAAIAEAIAATVPLQSEWTAMEYGCGTAVLSLLLADRLGHITAADASPGMLDQVRQKLAAHSVRNVEPLWLDLTQASLPDRKYDLIFCAMVLHHVDDLPDLIAKFVALLRPGGWLAVADLHAEDGSFHRDLAVPHHGFEPRALADRFAAAGLAKLSWRTVHALERQGRNYPIFLLTGTKEAAAPRPVSAEPA